MKLGLLLYIFIISNCSFTGSQQKNLPIPSDDNDSVPIQADLDTITSSHTKFSVDDNTDDSVMIINDDKQIDEDTSFDHAEDDTGSELCLGMTDCLQNNSCTTNLEICEPQSEILCLACDNDAQDNGYLPCPNLSNTQECVCSAKDNTGYFIEIPYTWNWRWEFSLEDCLTEPLNTNKIETDGGYFECRENNGVSYLEPVTPSNVSIPPYTYIQQIINNPSNEKYYGLEIRFQYFNFTSNPSNAYGIYIPDTFDEKQSLESGNASFVVTGKYLPFTFADDIALDIDTGVQPFHRVRIKKVGAHIGSTVTNPTTPLPWYIVRHAFDLQSDEMHTWVWQDDKEHKLFYILNPMNPQYVPNGLMIGINDKRIATSWSLARIDYIERFTWTPACVNL